MPNIQGAKKRLRQSIALREKNRSVKRSLKTQCKKVLEAVSAGNIDEAEKEYRQSAKILDRAAARKVIHANAAARTKSRLSTRVKTLKGK
ncbi:MAG: 30S ribosomal protein S20 [Pirellulales bacterium]|nr:30S ribosomal protein S20 [Pirellulales bacterium]